MKNKWMEKPDGYNYRNCNCHLCDDYRAWIKNTAIGSPELDFYCPNCGHYRISLNDYAALHKLSSEKRHMAVHICREMFLQGNEGYRVSVQDKDILIEGMSVEQRFPRSFSEQAYRTLLNIYNFVDNPYDEFSRSDISIWTFLSSNPLTVIDFLIEKGFLKNLAPSHQKEVYSLTLKGWEIAEEMLTRKNMSNIGFVAMWFDDETKKIRECIREAINRAGYDPVIIDEDHHCDYIMDRILNRIDEARFVIADFTTLPEMLQNGSPKPKYGVRGGVYFEAGYARGKGMPVIVTCRNDEASKSRIHFDIQQLNTIYWEEKDGKFTTCGHDLIEYLKERIIAVTGYGKNPLR